MPHIRNEQPGDEAAIHAVVSQAFGRALLSAGLARCRALRHTRVVVLGEPAYGGRGFQLPLSLRERGRGEGSIMQLRYSQ